MTRQCPLFSVVKSMEQRITNVEDFINRLPNIKESAKEEPKKEQDTYWRCAYCMAKRTIE